MGICRYPRLNASADVTAEHMRRAVAMNDAYLRTVTGTAPRYHGNVRLSPRYMSHLWSKAGGDPENFDADVIEEALSARRGIPENIVKKLVASLAA